MEPIFCCSSIQPYRPRILDHEHKFRLFMNWTTDPRNTSQQSVASDVNFPLGSDSSYVVQIVRQVNYGPLESKRYLAKISVEERGGRAEFCEVTEKDLIDANYQKLNSYKNFKCTNHGKFFELNIYEKDPLNTHHWRANIARPAADVDLPTKSMEAITNEKPCPPMQPIQHQVPLELSTKTTTPKDASDSTLEPALRLSQESKEPLDKEHRDSDGSENYEKLGSDRREGLADDESNRSEDGKSYSYNSHEDSYYDGFRGSDGSQSPRDFAGCSLEDCGYCGHCDY